MDTINIEEQHREHIKGGYFRKGCPKCAEFIGNYIMSGRKFKAKFKVD